MEIKVSNMKFDRNIPPNFLKYINNRDKHIVDICRGKNVLHIGACDHPFTRERWEKGIRIRELVMFLINN